MRESLTWTREGKIYFGLWFQKFQSIAPGSMDFMVVEACVRGSCSRYCRWKAKKGNRKSWGEDTSRTHSQCHFYCLKSAEPPNIAQTYVNSGFSNEPMWTFLIQIIIPTFSPGFFSFSFSSVFFFFNVTPHFIWCVFYKSDDSEDLKGVDRVGGRII